MIPILFSKDATSYNNNGIGVLIDVINCYVYEEHNGSLELELEYQASGELVEHIVAQNQILAKPNDIDEPHAFRIFEVEKDLESGLVYARAASITEDLGGNLITSLTVEDKTPQQVFDEMKQSLIEPTRFDFVSDIDTRSSSEWSLINPLTAIAGTSGSLVDLWGGDIKRTNNTVYLYSRRGRDKATTIRPGKNIDGFNMTVSTKGVVTKILPYFTYTPQRLPQYRMVEDYEGNMVKEQVYDDTTYEQPEQEIVIGDIVTSQNADKFAIQKYTPVDFSMDEYMQEIINLYINEVRTEVEESPEPIDTSDFPDRLRAFVTAILNEEASGYFIYRNPGVDEPKVSIKVNMTQLSDSDEWERYKNLETIQVTDTVDVYVKQYDIDVEVGIQSIRYDPIGERVITITAGNAKNSLVNSITQPYEEKINELEQYVNGMENGVYNSISKTASGQARRFSGYTEPPASISSNGDLWFKEVGNGNVESYIYKGGAWVPVVTQDTMEDIERQISDASALAQAADTKAQATIDEIQEVVVDSGFTTLADLIASKISDGEVSTIFFQQAKAIGLVYTKDGVDEAIIAIQDGIPYIKGEHIILDGNTIVDGTFTVTEEMLAENAIINNLIANGIDANEVRIINLDASSITSGDLELTNGFRITNNGIPVLEVDANTGQVKITAPNLATKEDLETIELTPGPQGPPGTAGKGVKSVTEYYLATTASTGVTTSTSGWTTTIQTITSTNRYLWNYEVVTYTDNSTTSTTPVVIGVFGSTGAAGKGISSITEYYLASSSATGVTTSTTGWTTTMQTTTTTNKYLWNYEVITYTDGTSTTISPVIIGTHGATGPQGIQGPAGTNGESQYVHIRYSANSNGSSMTTTPQSNTAYIGLANTTSSTAPTSNTAYTWSLFKGPQGSQGIQGPAGANGQTTYTWVKYADDDTGNGMSDTPDGKRYIGLAFNKTTATESTTKTDYAWSPLYDNVQVGGRNLYIDYLASEGYLQGDSDDLGPMNNLRMERTSDYIPVTPGENYSFQVWVTVDTTTSETLWMAYQFYDSTKARVGGRPSITTGQQLPSGKYYNIYNIVAPTNAAYIRVSARTYDDGQIKLENGNVSTDWSPSPEDVHFLIDNKAEVTDMDALASIVSSVSAEINLKAGMGELEAMYEAFNTRLENEIADKERLVSALNSLSGRTTLVETIARDNKIVTTFIDTFISESDEGIFIGSKAKDTGILIGTERISFLDAGVEVAYVSNQTMKINHGIFVESATISGFKFEKLPGTEILAIQWVGG